MIDLRSDTVTRPTKEMLDYMMKAPVGDDVFGEDPTINTLEEKLAKLFGMEAALFCPSGTMCNQIAMKVHTQPMDEIICDELSHIYYYETAGFAFHSGCSIRLIKGDKGRITAEQIKEQIQPDFDWLPVSKLVVIENTCNKGGGAFYAVEELKKIAKLCREKNLRLHMDGARFFNALVASSTQIEDYKGLFDSISICLSKGLGAPVGSVLLGNAAFIKRARKVRKAFGGGMRQAGILAAAGIFALDHHVEKLKDDHEKAKRLAEAIQQLDEVSHCELPVTNIVLFDLKENIAVADYLNYLKENGVGAVQFGKHTIRLVTHLDVSFADIDKVIEVMRKRE